MNASIGNTDVLWASIFASAGVAVLTTLIVEYFAKPRLEVRKERILGRDQERRSAFQGLLKAAYRCGQVIAWRHDLSAPVFRDRATNFAEEAQRLLDDAVTGLNLLDLPDDLEDRWDEDLAAITVTLVWIQFPSAKPGSEEPPDAVWDRFDEAAGMLDNYVALFDTPRWRWRRRQRIKSVITRDRLHGPGVGLPDPDDDNVGPGAGG